VKNVTQPQAVSAIRHGMFADLGENNTCSTQAGSAQRSSRSPREAERNAGNKFDKSPDFAFRSSGLQLVVYAAPGGGPAPASQAPAPKATAVDREVDEIISDVNREVSKLNENDNFYSIYATSALNEECEKASSKLVKQKLLEHPEIQKLIEQIVITAIRRGEDGISVLDSIIENKDFDPTLKDALLKRIFKDGTLINLLRDSMSPEEQNALDDLLAKEKSKKLPREIQLVSLCQISFYPNKKRVIDNLELLIKKQEFLNPHDRKFALTDQRTLVETVAYAAGHDGYRPLLITI
jgi:hypothetical protein